MPVRYNLAHMQRIAKEYGGKCLSTIYWDEHTLLKWMCAIGHTWDAPYTIIRQGGWCMQCAKNHATLEEIQEIARQRGGKCLSDKYIRWDVKLKFQCREGHIWNTTSGVIRRGSWCPACSGKMKYTLRHWQALARSNGGVCLSAKYKNIFIKLKWRCKAGHEWMAVPYSIRRGLWCKRCSDLARMYTLQDMHELAGKHGGKCLSTKYIYCSEKLEWECSKGHRWSATPAMMVNHGTWCPYCAGVAKLTIEEMHELAKARGGKCLSKRYINGSTKLKWKCKNGHVWMTTPQVIKAGGWCSVCSGNIKHTIKDAQRIAILRGGSCLSKVYHSNKTKLKWKCAEGHIWMAHYNSISLNRWCPYCAGYKKKSIEEMRSVAKRHGGKCLSSKYVNSITKLKWQCSRGHTWMALPSGITRKNGSWCPRCAHMKDYSKTKVLIT